MCELGLLFGHKLSHFKFEIHVVMHPSQRRLQTSKYQLASSNALALEMKDGTLIGLLHVTPKTTHFRFASRARVIYPPI